ncbi:pilus assembly protein FimV [Ectothiorhodospira haloalkaliphila]|uniref:FimV/HubP family polar landmark protein n=1 Tax=Ectothiorhodospira haloalkaliphila TaxID=421628 RepID=UPI001EE86A63|nr:pilus assembly protein FimV [Ectothiorhodospira haloalkaliphila]
MRRLALGTAVLALIVPGASLGLGLGEIEPRSALNQPLRAEIELVSVEPGEMDDLVVRLAPDALFTRMGIDRDHRLTELEFEPMTTRDGRHVIRVTSRDPIREPFLNFLIEASWPSGRLVREYTILLDPPTRFEQTRQPTPAPSAPAPGRETAPPGVTRAEAPRDTAPTTYRVSRGDTMWQLGERLRPDTGVSVEQMMLALLRANPEAFEDDNINNLRSGHVLRVPARDEITRLAPREARQEVVRQNRLWREYRERATEQPEPQVAVADEPAPPRDPAPDEAREPAPPAPVDDDARLEIVGDGLTDDEAQRLQRELALLRETTESRRQEAEELRNRVEELEGLLERQSRLLTLTNQQLADLQNQLARMEGRDPDHLPLALPSEPLPTTPEAVAPAPEPDAAPTPEVAPAPPAPATPAEPEPRPTALTQLLNNPSLLMGAGFGLLLILALLWLMIRRLRDREDGEDVATPLADASVGQEAGTQGKGTAAAVAAGAAAGGVAAARDDADRERPTFGVESDSKEDLSTAMMDTMETQLPSPKGPMGDSAELTDTMELSLPGGDAAEPEDGGPRHRDEVSNDDTVAEADVYLAYGLYQQAEDLLENAVKQDPDRVDYRFKLAETYFASKNREAFEGVAADMRQSLGERPARLWDRVVLMGQEISPDNPLFRGAAASGQGTHERPDTSDFDLDTTELEGSLSEVDFEIRDDMDDMGLGEDPASGDQTEISKIGELDLDLPEDIGADVPEDSGKAAPEDAPTMQVEETPGMDDEAPTRVHPPAQTATSAPDKPEERARTQDADDATLEFDLDDSDFLDEDWAKDVGEGASRPDLDEGADIDADEPTRRAGSGDDTATLQTDEPFPDLDEPPALDRGVDPPTTEGTGEQDDTLQLDADDLNFDLDDMESMGKDEPATPRALGEDLDSDADTRWLDDTFDADDAARASDELDSAEDDDFSLGDEISTKLDLARAYIEMGDAEGARATLEEVISDGDDVQRREAEELMRQIQ